MEQKKTFNPFEKVLTKNKENDAVWNCHFFSHYENDCIILVGGMVIQLDYTDILPFAGNEHLVGKSDMQEESVELKDGDLIYASDDVEHFEQCHIQLRKFLGISDNRILVSDTVSYWRFCIPFSQFNPNDLKETRKNILCVKNGRLVRYTTNNNNNKV